MYECCRYFGDFKLCRQCGYLSYAEVDQVLKLKPSAHRQCASSTSETRVGSFIRHSHSLRLLTGEREIRLTRAVPSPDELREKFTEHRCARALRPHPVLRANLPVLPVQQGALPERRGRGLRQGRQARDRPLRRYRGRQAGHLLLHRRRDTHHDASQRPGDIIGQCAGPFDLQCDIHMESHPNHLSAGNLRRSRRSGCEHLSIGVEALVDRHLKNLRRPYTASQVKEAVERCAFARVHVRERGRDVRPAGPDLRGDRTDRARSS